MGFIRGDRVKLAEFLFTVWATDAVSVYLSRNSGDPWVFYLPLDVAESLLKRVVQPPPVNSCIRLEGYLALVRAVNTETGHMYLQFADGSGSFSHRYDKGNWELVATREK